MVRERLVRLEPGRRLGRQLPLTCRNAHSENEQVVANQQVNVAPGTSQQFTVSINPCNPVADDAGIWIRITLSNAPLAHSDGSGPSQCMYGGETEDYFRQIAPTAVELASFTATPQAQSILIEWETVSEIDNLGFNLYRATSPDRPADQAQRQPDPEPGTRQPDRLCLQLCGSHECALAGPTTTGWRPWTSTA